MIIIPYIKKQVQQNKYHAQIQGQTSLIIYKITLLLQGGIYPLTLDNANTGTVTGEGADANEQLMKSYLHENDIEYSRVVSPVDAHNPVFYVCVNETESINEMYNWNELDEINDIICWRDFIMVINNCETEKNETEKKMKQIWLTIPDNEPYKKYLEYIANNL